LQAKGAKFVPHLLVAYLGGGLGQWLKWQFSSDVTFAMWQFKGDVVYIVSLREILVWVVIKPIDEENTFLCNYVWYKTTELTNPNNTF